MQGTTARPRLPAAQRREAILDAALELFAEDGYESTSIGRIATAARVSRPVLYDHFASKQDLYVSLLSREAARMGEALISSHQPEALLGVRLRTLALTAISFARRHTAAVELLLQAPVGDRQIRAAHEEAREQGRRAIAAAILADPLFPASPGLTRRGSAELLGDLQNAVLERLIRWAIDHPRAPARALGDVFAQLLRPAT